MEDKEIDILDLDCDDFNDCHGCPMYDDCESKNINNDDPVILRIEDDDLTQQRR